MKFRSEQGILVETLGALARIASARNAGTPALSGVKMTLTGDVLVLSSTDNDVAIQFVVAVGGDTDGQALVSARTLSDIVRVMPQGKVTLEVAGDVATVSAGRSQFTIPTLNAVEFPRLTPPTGDPVTIKSTEFKRALGQVVLAASRDPQKIDRNAVLLTSTPNGLRLVATDGYRMAMRELAGAPGDGIDQFLIPARALAELQRLLDMSDEVNVRFSDTEAAFQTPAMTLSTRLINAQFPPYLSIIPKDAPNIAVVNRDEILDALRRTGVLASETAPVRIRMSGEGATLTVTLPDGSTSVDDIDAQFTGEEITLAFNADYLASGIDACGTEEVTIATSAPNKPAVIRPSGDDSYLYLLMPQRL